MLQHRAELSRNANGEDHQRPVAFCRRDEMDNVYLYLFPPVIKSTMTDSKYSKNATSHSNSSWNTPYHPDSNQNPDCKNYRNLDEISDCCLVTLVVCCRVKTSEEREEPEENEEETSKDDSEGEDNEEEEHARENETLASAERQNKEDG
ncbi:hypothetical protein FPQ18DRAFT_310558 [Pyronema domesticum]|nr:hypothetical protein FPQ18DRAFT_310558 [Pyronema domesticum]